MIARILLSLLVVNSDKFGMADWYLDKGVVVNVVPGLMRGTTFCESFWNLIKAFKQKANPRHLFGDQPCKVERSAIRPRDRVHTQQ